MPLVSRAEIADLVEAFTNASLPRASWTHHAHLIVATWHLVSFDAAEALVRIREGILRLNAANQIPQTVSGGYHETLTRFYMWAVGEALAELDYDAPIEVLCHAVIARCGSRELPLVYYTAATLMSWTARTTWVEPDARALESLSYSEL
jgi:hypothetical protein